MTGAVLARDDNGHNAHRLRLNRGTAANPHDVAFAIAYLSYTILVAVLRGCQVSWPRDEAASNAAAEPFLKWPGGKRALLPSIIPLLPSSYSTYYEPFLGGGAVFFSLAPHRAVLSDTNPDLINAYVQVRDNPERVIKELRTLRNSERDYYAQRAARPRSPLKKAVRLLYLSTLSFNGIHRVNLKGEFNVPYGHKAYLPTCNETQILSASDTLQGTTLKVSDFETATQRATPGSLIYFDPPYTVAHGANGFLKYNEHIFSWADQLRLANTAKVLAERGCCVVVSNADHPSVRRLYPGFEAIRLHRFSRIAATSTHRRMVSELAFISKGK